MKMINELYQYRELLKTSVKKEIRGKYKGSVLGILWSFINPLLMVLVYALVFPYIMGDRISEDVPYLIFLVVAIIPWTFFTSVLSQGVSVIKNNAGIIKKVYFPREILPLSVALSGLVNFFISCIITLLFCVSYGVGTSWHLVLLPVIAILQFMISLGAILLLCSINAYIQDTEYIITFVINMLFYGTPILYDINVLSQAPAILQTMVRINPMTHLINMYRDIFIYHVIPEGLSFIYVLVVGIIVLTIGMLAFKKLEKGFAEEL